MVDGGGVTALMDFLTTSMDKKAATQDGARTSEPMRAILVKVDPPADPVHPSLAKHRSAPGIITLGPVDSVTPVDAVCPDVSPLTIPWEQYCVVTESAEPPPPPLPQVSWTRPFPLLAAWS